MRALAGATGVLLVLGMPIPDWLPDRRQADNWQITAWEQSPAPDALAPSPRDPSRPARADRPE